MNRGVTTEMKAEDERTKLFNEVWSEPMTTVSQRYGLSDNGLRKRCVKLEIPLPPIGYWTKRKAGLAVPPKPKLPPLKVNRPTIVLKDTKQELEIEFIDLDSQSTEDLKMLDGLGVLTPNSREDFVKWRRKIQVPKKVDPYLPLIIEYQKEIEYRKVRDKEHKFREYFRYTDISLNSEVKYRDDSPVLPIDVSDKQSQRAFRIVDALIKTVENLNGKVIVEKYFGRGVGAKDNAKISVFKNSFTFQIREMMTKRREVMAGLPAAERAREFRPLYEKVFIGTLEMEFQQMPGYREESKQGPTFTFKDSAGLPLEDQLGEMILVMFKAAQEARIAEVIREREEEAREMERERLHAIEEEQRKKQQELMAREKRQKQLVENIEQQMDGWFQAQKLRRYADEIERYAKSAEDPATKESLDRYVKLVREKAGKCDPIAEIISEIKAIGIEVE